MLRKCITSASPSVVNRVLSRGLATTAVRADDKPKPRELEGIFQDQQQPKRRGAFSLNRIDLIGGVADNPISRVSRNGTEYITFNMFTNVDFRKADGSYGSHTELHNIHVFGGQANFVKRVIQRGSRVFISGRLHYEGGQVRPDGTRSPRIASITAEAIQPIGSRRTQEGEGLPSDASE